MYAVQIVVFTFKKNIFILYTHYVQCSSVCVQCTCKVYMYSVHVQCMCTVYTEHYKVHKLKCVKKTYIS